MRYFFQCNYVIESSTNKAKFARRKERELNLQLEHANHLTRALHKVYKQHSFRSLCCGLYRPSAFYRPPIFKSIDELPRWFGSIEEAWAEYLSKKAE